MYSTTGRSMGVILEGTTDMASVFFFFSFKEEEPRSRAHSKMALWPASDFDPKRISKIYNIKTLCNYEMSCFYQKILYL